MTIEEMITEVLEWGLKPKTITTDAWYSSRKNLKFFKNKELEFLTGIAKNRLCTWTLIITRQASGQVEV